MVHRFRRLRRITLASSLVVVFVALGLAMPNAASPMFMIADIGALPGQIESVASGLNNQGTVVGYGCTAAQCAEYHAALWGDGRIRDLGTLGGSRSVATAINSLSHIVGSSATASGAFHAFRISTGGTMTDLGTLGGPSSTARDINRFDVVVGDSTAANDTRFRAVIFQNGTVTEIGSFNDFSWANAINSSGQIVGAHAQFERPSRAFMYDMNTGAIVDLHAIWGSASTWASDINDAGQITGTRCSNPFAGSCQAIKYDSRTGAIVEIPSLGGSFSAANGLNQAGDVVGTSSLFSGDRRAFLYTNGRTYELQSLIPMDNGWTLTEANAMNDVGQIVGVGNFGAARRGFILTPTISSPWATQDIGPTGLTGSAIRSLDGPFTVRGAGRDIWDTADSFHFVHKPLFYTVDGEIIARVDSLTDTGRFAKAGVMIRGTEATNAPHVILDIKPDGGVEFMQRDATAADTHYIAGAFAPPPYWLKLARDGSTVTGSISPDGHAWTAVGSTMITSEPETLSYGLAVTSHDTSALNTAIFSGVSLLPAGWSAHDVGATNRMGSTSYMGTVFSIEAAGRDIWDTTDSFHFVHQLHSGNGEIVAQILRVPNTHQFAKAGVMIRDGLATGAAHVILDVKPDGNVEFMQRSVAARETAYLAGGSAPPPSWIKLRREANVVTGYVSPNGSTWTAVGSTTVNFPSSVEFGVAVTSHDNNTLAGAEVANVTVR